mgnify:CR=1 FL=1
MLAEIGETAQGILEVAPFADGESIEAATSQVLQLVAQHVADGAQLSPVAVAFAQQARGRVAASVGELGEVDGDEREVAKIVGDRLGGLAGVEPDADRAFVRQDLVAARLPDGERENDELIMLANTIISDLENRGVKAVVLACNTLSSLIVELSARVPLFSVIEAGVQETLNWRDRGLVGLIATTMSMRSSP